MRFVPQFPFLAALAAVGVSALSCNKPNQLFHEPALPAATQPGAFTEEDRQVLEAVLVSLICDPEYKPDGARSGRFDSIALIDQTAKSPQYPKEELDRCPPQNGMTPTAMLAYQDRNNQRSEITATGWDLGIRIISERQLPKDQYVGMPDARSFCAQNPGTKGWTSAGLPCYLGDGTRAYVEIAYHWSAAHSASGEFLLEKVDGKWRVQRRSFKLYG